MRERIKKSLPFLLVLFLGLLLRLPHLNASFWLDEAAQALESYRPLAQQLQITDDFQPPLLHLLTHASISICQKEWWLRTTGALIPGMLTIVGTYALGKKIAGKKVALASSLLLATSSFHLFFSQELRPYSLSAFFTVFSWLFLLEALKFGQDIYQIKPQRQINRFFALFPIERDFFLFLATTIGGLYSSYLYPFVFLSQLFFLIINKKIRLFSYALAIPSIAFMAWLPSFLAQLQAGQALRTSFPGWENIVSFSLLKAPALTAGKFLFGIIDLEFISFSRLNSFPFLQLNNFAASWHFLLALLLLLFFLLPIIFSRDFVHQQTKPIWLFLSQALLLPFALASLVSIWIPLIQPKRVIFLLPFTYLAFSYLIFEKRKNWSELTTAHWGAFFLILLINLHGCLSYYTQEKLQKEPWREAVANLHQQYSPVDTIVLFSFKDPFAPWRWYEKDNLNKFPTLSTGSYHLADHQQTRQLLLPAANYKNIIVFDYLTSLTDPNNYIKEVLHDFGYTESQNYDYNSLGLIRVYQQVGTERFE